jgi:uncharacterized protein (TIGR03437 family)
MTRRFAFRALSAGVVAVMLAAPGWAATFGKIVPIGGNASDIVLDEARHSLYIANFTANRIEVMSTDDLTISRSINVNPQPGSMAMSPDGRYLVIGHYNNQLAPASDPAIPQSNALTVLNLEDNTRQIFALGSSPLGIAFGADGLALIVTASNGNAVDAGAFFLFDPAAGTLHLLETLTTLSGKTLPAVPPIVFPPQITTGSLAASGDGSVIYGVTDGLLIRYIVKSRDLVAVDYSAVPPLGPRLASVSGDGGYFALGWSVSNTFYPNPFIYQFTIAGGALNVGTHAIDASSNTIYAQVPEQLPPPAPPTSSTICFPDGRCVVIVNAPNPNATQSQDTRPANLMIADLDNLNVRDRMLLAENLGGRSVLNKALDTMYSISDSGVTVFPVGPALRTVHRIAASQEDVVFHEDACNKNIAFQEITITDPGGGGTDFSLTPLAAGISAVPSQGVTPAKVRIYYNPSAFQNQRGTTAITLKLKSQLAVNIPQDIRVLINNHDSDQRGLSVNVPGRLVDVVPDAVHDRYYILRQDRNQVLVFDAGTNSQIATLRTSNTPTQMAITTEGKYLLVGHNDAQIISVFDLDTLKPDPPVYMQSGHYARSVAVSGRAILAAARVAGPIHMISKVDMASRKASPYAALGPFKNTNNIDTVLISPPNHASILAAMPDGTVMLYDANADTFSVQRKDFTALSGAYAASSYGVYTIGNNVLNASLAPAGQLGTDSGTGAGISAGFAFIEQLGYRTSTTDATGAGVIQKIDFNLGTAFRATRIVESPLFTPPLPPVDPNLPVTPAPVQVNSFAFKRTLAALVNRATLLSLSQSGFTILPAAYDAPTPIPQISKIVNAADQTKPVAPGGLINVMGSNLSLTNLATSEIPMPTALGDSCLTVNGIAIPLLLVSSSQINAQLPFNIEGNSQMVLRTPGGVSDNMNFSIQSTAPSVFRSTAGGADGASVFRAANNALVSDANPIQAGDELIVYATGLGRTSPAVDTGAAAPSNPLAAAMVQPDVTLDGVPLAVDYAGLTPGGVGVYQINVRVPGNINPGSSVPLTIQQGGNATTVALQVAAQ